MDLDIEESIDFDFFDELPESHEDVTAASLAQKPPVHPSSAKSVPKTDMSSDAKFTDHARRSSSSSESDYSRDSSPENLSISNSKNENNNKSVSSRKKTGLESQSPSSSFSSASSARNSFSSSSPLAEKPNRYYDNHLGSKDSDNEKINRSLSSNDSDIEGRPTNPTSKPDKQALKKMYPREEVQQSHSRYYKNDIRKTKKSAVHCDDDGDSNWSSKNINRKHGWEEVNETKRQEKRPEKTHKTSSKDRPKTAGKKRSEHLIKDKNSRSRSASSTLSDSDITDVSSINTPRNNARQQFSDKSEHSKMTSAGDGHPVKLRFKSISGVGQKDKAADQDYDPDKMSGLDLKILMKAVGELDKQKRIQSNSRRVMFEPSTVRSMEKDNYTFDKNQTRDIERENHRLLKEIVRQVNSEEQKKQFYKPSSLYRLTPSAVNRERDIQRIERENLAFLRRLQEVKPTKSIARDQQLRAYESTVYHGVPLTVHHKPKGRHAHDYTIDDSDASIDGRARSVTSITSVGSSVRSAGSSRGSRPSSASRKSGSSTKRIYSRPPWSDRW